MTEDGKENKDRNPIKDRFKIRSISDVPRGLLFGVLVAVGLLIIIAIVLIFSLGEGDEGTPIAPLPQPTIAPSPTLVPPSATPTPPDEVSISLPPGAIQLVVERDQPVSLVSPNGDVKVTSDAGVVGEKTVLVFEPLNTAQLPELPKGSGAAFSAFDLSPFATSGDKIEEFVFSQPVILTFDLTDELVELAAKDSSIISVWHYKDSSALWEELPSTVDLQARAISAEVLTLSIFALLASEEELEPTPPPLVLAPTATATSVPTLTPTPVPTATPVPPTSAPPTFTATPTPEPTSTFTPTPTSTFTPLPTATRTSTPSPTPIIITGGGGSPPPPPPTATPIPPPALAVAITSPGNLALVNKRLVSILGTVSGQSPTVKVNGVSAAVSEGAFSALVSMREGVNNVVATAVDVSGQVQDTVTITLDTPPMVTIDSPPNGFVTASNTVTITGRVNDLVIGTINGDQVQVKVGAFDANVSNRAYLAGDIPLTVGENLITAVATDKAGNTSSASVTVFFEEVVGTASIATVSGNNQSGLVGQVLPEPLTVELRDANGDPVAGKIVIFEVMENNGTLSNSPGNLPSLAAQTDENGIASVNWTLGARAGAGNNLVEASAVGFAGMAIFTATGQSAQPDKINVDAGNNQTGVSGEALEKPFVAIVTDAGHNRLQGIPVTFEVIQGGGNLGGETSVVVQTDSDGRALASLTLGPGDGFDNNVVSANFAGNLGLAATFVATGMIPGDPLQTIVSGVVLDNTNIPVVGVTMHIEGTALTALTDEQGQFSLQPAPVGDIHLIADGSTTERDGVWPQLEFEMMTVAGQENTLGMPIFMLPLDLENGLFVDESTGGVLTLDEVPGFSLSVAPGSVTFPDGSNSGILSVTVVHNDKVPMVPNFGQQPRFVVTIQPAGTIFDPPAPITIPNVDGLAPGEVTEMYSFDHDLGQFVSIGTGTVSDDGTIIASDPGFGIIKGGWHCGGNPNQTGSAEPVHVKITSPGDEDDETPPGGTLPGSPTPTSVPSESSTQQVVNLKVDETLTITAEGGPAPGEYIWKSSDPSVVEIMPPTQGANVSSVTVKALQGGSVNITVTYKCQSGATATDSILIEVDDGNISFVLQDPNVWPKRQQNPFVDETDEADISDAVIQGQNDAATGVNPATVNDDNFEFKMKQPEEDAFSLHNDDSTLYEMMSFKDINGNTAVRIFPLIDGERVAKKEGEYVFKLWNDDDDDDPFTSEDDSGVRDFAGNMLDFIPNTQIPEPFVEITVTFEKQGDVIKVSEVPKVKKISEGDY